MNIHGFLKSLTLPSNVSPSVWYTTFDAIDDSVPKISNPATLRTDEACTILTIDLLLWRAVGFQVYL